MKIHPAVQGTQAWLEARAGVPSASELGNLITDKFAIRKGEMVQTYLARKLAEKWTGGPLMGCESWATEQGQLLEELAIPWLEFEHDLTVQRVGFITNDEGTFGASPDGIIGGENRQVGLEIKCLQPIGHVKALLGGLVPEEYLPQIHGGMFATGFNSWNFLAFNRGFPPLWLTMERDDAKQEVIFDALTMFQERFETGWAKLIELNGGELPPKREPMIFAQYRSEFPS
jgi:hypothetical protein